MITYSEMVRRLAKSGQSIVGSLSPVKAHVWHMSSCLMGEVGEIFESSNDANILEELGDLEFYFEGLRSGVGFTIEQIEDMRSQIVPGKYPSNFALVVYSAGIFDSCKKWIIYEKDIDKDILLKMMASFQLYLVTFAAQYNLSRQQIQDANMLKLSKRYGSDFSYSNQKAQERADKQPLGFKSSEGESYIGKEFPERKIIGGARVDWKV